MTTFDIYEASFTASRLKKQLNLAPLTQEQAVTNDVCTVLFTKRTVAYSMCADVKLDHRVFFITEYGMHQGHCNAHLESL